MICPYGPLLGYCCLGYKHITWTPNQQEQQMKHTDPLQADASPRIWRDPKKLFNGYDMQPPVVYIYIYVYIGSSWLLELRQQLRTRGVGGGVGWGGVGC